MTEEFDPLDPWQQDEQREATDQQRALVAQQQAADFLWLMSDPRGRRLVWRQLADSGIFQQSFNPEAMTMAFNEGRRSAGLRLISQVHTLCPDLYTIMMKEQLQ